MLKKILIIIGIVLSVILVVIFTVNKKNNNSVKIENDEISEIDIVDDCIDEWEDFSVNIKEENAEVANNVSDENKRFIVKSINDVICVFYEGNNNEEILYKNTDLSTKYLGNEDIEELKKGIKVTGIEKLNELLENFE